MLMPLCENGGGFAKTNKKKLIKIKHKNLATYVLMCMLTAKEMRLKKMCFSAKIKKSMKYE